MVPSFRDMNGETVDEVDSRAFSGGGPLAASAPLGDVDRGEIRQAVERMRSQRGQPRPARDADDEEPLQVERGAFGSPIVRVAQSVVLPPDIEQGLTDLEDALTQLDQLTLTIRDHIAGLRGRAVADATKLAAVDAALKLLRGE